MTAKPLPFAETTPWHPTHAGRAAAVDAANPSSLSTRARWDGFKRCEDCGADARQACRTEDDLVAIVPCPGRQTRGVNGRPAQELCHAGHVLADPNLIHRKGPRGSRECRTCHNARSEQSRQRKLQAKKESK